MIEFKHVNQFDRGIIYKLLCESYASLLESEGDYTHEFKANWQQTDADLSDGFNTSGRAVISIRDNQPVGFVSWYVEGGDVGSIGHNCIVPRHRRKGYGKAQIHKALEELARRVRLVKVTTANHPFFLAARKTYLSCGFIEVGRSRTDAYGGLELIHYEHARKQNP